MESRVEATPKSLFLESLRRCQQRRDFLRRFYERFVTSSPVVSAKFRFTDFDRQERMLMRSLELAAGATEGHPDSLAELARRSETHSRAHLDIGPELYALWLEHLLATAQDCDPDWTPEIEDAWRTILGFVIRHMLRSYELYDPDGMQ